MVIALSTEFVFNIYRGGQRINDLQERQYQNNVVLHCVPFDTPSAQSKQTITETIESGATL